MVVLPGEKAQDIHASGGGFGPVHQGAAQTAQGAPGNGAQQLVRDGHVSLDKSGAVQGQGEEHGADDAVDEELPAHVFPGDPEQGDVEHQAGDARGPAGKVVEDDGYPGDASGEEMVLDKEGVDGKGHQKAS